jgi:hypothetical protein
MNETIDIAHKGLLYVHYGKESKIELLTYLESLDYTIRDYLWDEDNYTFPVVTIDQENKIVFGAGVTIMACLITQGGKSIPLDDALRILSPKKNHQQ